MVTYYPIPPNSGILDRLPSSGQEQSLNFCTSRVNQKLGLNRVRRQRGQPVRTFLFFLKRSTLCSLHRDEIALSECKAEAKPWSVIPKFVLERGVIKFL